MKNLHSCLVGSGGMNLKLPFLLLHAVAKAIVSPFTACHKKLTFHLGLGIRLDGL